MSITCWIVRTKPLKMIPTNTWCIYKTAQMESSMTDERHIIYCIVHSVSSENEIQGIRIG